MDDILRELSSRLGIAFDQAESGAGALLSFIGENASQLDFQQLLNSVPEAASWMGKTAMDGAMDGGGLFDQAAGLLGGFVGSASGVLTALSRSGLNPEAAFRFVPEMLGLLQERAGGDLISRLMGSIPVLGEFVGGRRPSP
jgi:uncharacterized membrane protein YeaQ/YmgE (transglycosylase-associated protein family)